MISHERMNVKSIKAVNLKNYGEIRYPLKKNRNEPNSFSYNPALYWNIKTIRIIALVEHTFELNNYLLIFLQGPIY